MATSPKWEYRGIPYSEHFTPDVSNKLRRKLVALLGESRESAKFIDELKMRLYLYTCIQENECSCPEGHPTRPEMVAAAKVILRDSSKLFRQISGQAGGLKPYLDYQLTERLAHSSGHFTLGDMRDALEAVMRGCQYVMENDLWGLNMNPHGVSPGKLFACRVACLVREVLKEEPKKYMPDDLETSLVRSNSKGTYARILAACFVDLDGSIPGNLREIILYGINATADQ